ncbi:MAG: nucleotidyltransferase domain-containing protein [Acidobacteriota bacterium]
MPLPVGTEVTTRVDRVLGERGVPQGAVGRVIALHGEELDVQVVGIGVGRYRRSELLPRKAGQARFATAREAAWQALRANAVLETTVGSRAWGLATEDSDTDVRGVFVLPLPWAHGLVEPPSDLASADGSATFWEAGKAIRQALRADPNTLEMLFVLSARALDPMGEWILAARDAFVSSEIYGSFGRYALSQCKRLRQSLKLAEHRTLVLEWLREEPAPELDAVAERLRIAAGILAPTEADARLQAKEHVKELYRSLHDQGLLAAQSFDALIAFARGPASGLDLPRELRPKNAYNLLRLIATAIRWLREGTPDFEVRGDLLATLRAIKDGAVPLHDVLAMAEERAEELEEARRLTRLPSHPDVTAADALLRRIGLEAAARHVRRTPDRWGRDAAPPPVARWDDAS